MKSQLRLGLWRVGKHRYKGDKVWPDWTYRLGVADALRQAFEMNCVPKHSGETHELPYTIMDYATGAFVWHCRVYY